MGDSQDTVKDDTFPIVEGISSVNELSSNNTCFRVVFSWKTSSEIDPLKLLISKRL